MSRVHQRALLLVAGGVVVALAAAAALLGALPADAAVRKAVLALAFPPVVAAMRVVNWGGAWQVLLPATLLLLLVFGRARSRWWVWIGLMVAAPAAEQILKLAVGRPRPEDASLGFPSGHATAAAAFFGATVYLAGALPPAACRLVRLGSVVAMVLVGLARVILRAHWPSDVLAGLALGLALAAGAVLVDSAPAEGADQR